MSTSKKRRKSEQATRPLVGKNKARTITVELTENQAARFDYLAGLMKVSPEALVKVLSLGAIDGMDAYVFLQSWDYELRHYVARNLATRCASRGSLESELRAMPRGLPLKIATTKTDEEFDRLWKRWYGDPREIMQARTEAAR